MSTVESRGSATFIVVIAFTMFACRSSVRGQERLKEFQTADMGPTRFKT